MYNACCSLEGKYHFCFYSSAIPSISFHDESTSVDMREKRISIPVTNSSAVVRPFLVGVYVESTSEPPVAAGKCSWYMYMYDWLPCPSGERRPLPCINFKDSVCPAELPRWLSW